MARATYLLPLILLTATAAFAQEEEGVVEGSASTEDVVVEDGPVIPVEEPVDDSEPPVFEDVAVAAGSPRSPARVTAVVTDDASGITVVLIHYRRGPAGPFEQLGMTPGEGGMFAAQLPAGLNRTGFYYYVEARDAAGNSSAVGSSEHPFRVKAVPESEYDRVKRVEEAEKEREGINPLWPAIAIGAGVVGIAIGGYLWFDTYSIYDTNLVGVDASSAAAQPYVNAIIIDVAMAIPLTVLGIAGAATGATLLVLSAYDE